MEPLKESSNLEWYIKRFGLYFDPTKMTCVPTFILPKEFIRQKPKEYYEFFYNDLGSQGVRPAMCGLYENCIHTLFAIPDDLSPIMRALRDPSSKLGKVSIN